MKAHEVYAHLERDFIKPELTDYNWVENMQSITDLISDNFKQRNMGLLADFASDITHVYTAVFPSPRVLNQLLASGVHDVLLFVHHPAVWILGDNPDADAFKPIDRELLLRCKEQRIALYCLHVPLDDYGPYSTSVTFAKALGIQPQKSFAYYFGAYSGVFGTCDCKTVDELHKKFEQAVGHEVRVCPYGLATLSKTLAVAAGGGLSLEVVQEIAAAECNILVTGLTVNNSYSRTAHEYAKQHGITVLGGTHYSTEQFACRALCDYFKKVGLPTQFVVDEPSMNDL